MKHITVVSADGHVGCHYEGYRPYIDPQYRDRLDDLAEEDKVTVQALQIMSSMMTVPGINDIKADEVTDVGSFAKRRLAELDKEGIAAEILLVGALNCTPFFFSGNKPYPTDVRAAGARAYNRWVADLVSEGKGRLKANGYLGPCTDIDATLAELKWLADNGFVSVEVPGSVPHPDLPPLYSPYYERLWAACSDYGLNLILHAGWGMPQGILFNVLEQAAKTVMLEGVDGCDLGAVNTNMMEMGAADKLDMDTEGSPFALDMGPRQVMWQLMLSGVFDRYPSLKLIPTEVRADWVPETLAFLDKQFAQHPNRPKLKPSEYFARNCGVTPSSPRLAEVKMRHEIGVDQFMFGADIPHPESTWPNTRQWIRHAFAGVPEAEARKILGENAIRLFNLDSEFLAGIASRIGPTAAEVFAGEALDEQILETFDMRGGYRHPAEVIDTGKIEEQLTPDLVATSL